jgi:hypothetical protein
VNNTPNFLKKKLRSIRFPSTITEIAFLVAVMKTQLSPPGQQIRTPANPRPPLLQHDILRQVTTTSLVPNLTATGLELMNFAASITDHPQVTSRWDEIRTANARGGKSSTWDSLRQSHERQQATDHLQSSRVPTIVNDADAERIREQERFVAMLVAERKAAGR